MSTVDTVVIGAGHAGLATSRLLTQAGHDHVVLERGRVGERWRSERWDSLHLLTPNWLLALPGSRYGGLEPDGFTPAARFVEMLEEYAASFAAPVVDGTTVEEVRASGRGTSAYTVTTDRGTWHTHHLVVATGPHGVPVTPEGIDRARLGDTALLAARDYKNPGQLAPGGVLVVGASASGVQIAEELQRAGRQVTLAVGRHSRMPRTYRGFDIYWWLEATGRLRRTFDGAGERDHAWREPSLQLIGRRLGGRPASEVDLAALQRLGVRLTGRFREVSGGVARFTDDLPARVGEAEERMHAFLDVADEYVEASGLVREVWAADRPSPVSLPARRPTRLDLRAEGVSTVVLATGYRPHHPWLRLPVLDAHGRIAQVQGATAAPGVHTVGQRFQSGRASGTIAGASADAAHVVDQITGRTSAPALRPEAAS